MNSAIEEKKAQVKVECPPHKYHLTECKDDRDTYRCERCGDEFTQRCTFDEDYA